MHIQKKKNPADDSDGLSLLTVSKNTTHIKTTGVLNCRHGIRGFHYRLSPLRCPTRGLSTTFLWASQSTPNIAQAQQSLSISYAFMERFNKTCHKKLVSEPGLSKLVSFNRRGNAFCGIKTATISMHVQYFLQKH